MDYTINMLHRKNKTKDVFFVFSRHKKQLVKALQQNPEFKEKYQVFGFNVDEYSKNYKNIQRTIKLARAQNKQIAGLVYNFGTILPPLITQNALLLNIHFSELPMWRGCCPVIPGILSTKGLGITVHKVTENVDSGDIFYRKSVSLDNFCTKQAIKNNIQLINLANAQEITENLHKQTLTIVVPYILESFLNKKVFNKDNYVKQEAPATYSKRALLNKTKAKIDFKTQDAFSILHKVSALYPEPVAFTDIMVDKNKKELNIHKVAVVYGLNLNPGQVGFIKNQGLFVGTLAGVVKMQEGAISGKKVLKDTQWLSLKGRIRFI